MMYRIAPTLLLMTACFGVQAQLIGTYTVGGTSPDYATLTAALDDLSAQGATGSVTFNLRPGTYTGQYSLVTIAGTPGFITIKSENNDPSSVVLAYDAAGTTDNYILRLDGTDRMVLSHLTFRPLDPFYARAIHFFNACAILSIQQCVFEGSTDPDQSSGFERHIIHCDQNVIGTVDNPQDVMISENSFLNGYAARHPHHLLRRWQPDPAQRHTRLCHQWLHGYRGGQHAEHHRQHDQQQHGVRERHRRCVGPGRVQPVGHEDRAQQRAVAEGNALPVLCLLPPQQFRDGQDALVRNNIFANNAGGLAYNVATVPHNVAVRRPQLPLHHGSSAFQVGGPNAATQLADHQSGTGQGLAIATSIPSSPGNPTCT
jgi:hypothetical protein